MKRFFPALLAAVLLVLAACAQAEPDSPARQFQLYFASTASCGPAITGETYTGEDDTTADELIEALLSGPSSEDLRSPFPAGLALRGTTLEDGHLTVDFSEPYGGLTDVSLTLADYCVVLTVCQLGSVDSVEITVSGQPMAYRSHRVLTREEAVLFTK